ncbi:MAG: hypothetical protein R6U52_11330 [Kosmotogaceae bacterium]
MKKFIVLFSMILLATISMAGFSLGINNVVAKTESFTDTPLSGFVGIDVIGLDARYELGPLIVGLETPFIMFSLSEDTGVNTHFIIPGIAWHGYIGAKVGLGPIYILGDIGHTLALGEQLELGFSPLRFGAGINIGNHIYLELTTVAIIQSLKETIGKIYTLQAGFTF